MKLRLYLADYLILNEVEASQLLRISQFPGKEAAKLLKEKFPQSQIILTLGEAGSVYCGENTFICQPAYSVRAVDTTAAGDTFTGYFIAGISWGMGAEDALELASRAAAVTVTRPGAAPSIPSMEEVEAFLAMPSAPPATH